MVHLGPAVARWTDRHDGDLRLLSAPGETAEARRRAIVDLPWAWVQQVHEGTVVTIDDRFERPAARADALVTARRGLVLSVRTADCGAVALASPEGVIGAVHAGWRGLLAGVVEHAVAAMEALGATEVEAALGPCIHAACYEFGPSDLDLVTERFGPAVASTTAEGASALDLPAAIGAALAAAGAQLTTVSPICTACSPDHWSHRARGDVERQALAVWVPA